MKAGVDFKARTAGHSLGKVSPQLLKLSYTVASIVENILTQSAVLHYGGLTDTPAFRVERARRQTLNINFGWRPGLKTPSVWPGQVILLLVTQCDQGIDRSGTASRHGGRNEGYQQQDDKYAGDRQRVNGVRPKSIEAV